MQSSQVSRIVWDTQTNAILHSHAETTISHAFFKVFYFKQFILMHKIAA